MVVVDLLLLWIALSIEPNVKAWLRKKSSICPLVERQFHIEAGKQYSATAYRHLSNSFQSTSTFPSHEYSVNQIVCAIAEELPQIGATVAWASD